MHSWADQFNTYDEACHYYGVDTPAQVAEECRLLDIEQRIADQDELEAFGSPAARSLARVHEHQVWTREALGREATDAELVRVGLWGSDQTEAERRWLPGYEPDPLHDDGIPF